MKRSLTSSFLLAAVLAAVGSSGSAAELTVDPTTEFCFSAEDFTAEASDSGIFLTGLPDKRVAEVYYGDRLLHAGDAIPRSGLNQLTLVANCTAAQTAALEYYAVGAQEVPQRKALQLSILPQKNDPPEAKDSSLETYRNLPNSGELSGSDPENKPLTFLLETAPKRGTVELEETGSFTYTPEHNKVGKDQFTFCVLDDAGNRSNTATVSIEIKKPSDRAVYEDMQEDPDAFCALWLKDQGIYSGSSIGGHLCFHPDETVSRGEFLVMAMNLVDAEADAAQMTSGFADELQTPAWMQPYIVSALSNGMITGVHSENGVVFRPASAMTKAETVVLLQNMLHLPLSETTAVFAPEEEPTIPVWAMEAAAALSQAGIQLDMEGEADPLTRRDAAKVLYQVQCLMEQTEETSFFWAQ